MVNCDMIFPKSGSFFNISSISRFSTHSVNSVPDDTLITLMLPAAVPSVQKTEQQNPDSELHEIQISEGISYSI